MRRLSRILFSALLAMAFGAAALAAPAFGAPSPAWNVSSLATPTNFTPGDAAGEYSYDLRVLNVGGAASDGSPINVVDTLPAGVELVGDPEFKWRLREPGASGAIELDLGPEYCETEKVGTVSKVSCVLPEELPEDEEDSAVVEPLEELRIGLRVFTPSSVPEGTALLNRVTVEGGGAAKASFTSQGMASSQPAHGGFSYFRESVTGDDGLPAEQAGSHPFQAVTSFAINTRRGAPGSPVAFVPAGGDLKEIRVELPPGLIANPTAAAQCTARDFNTTHTETIGDNETGGGFYPQNDCPDDSVVGVINLQDVEGLTVMTPAPIYNLVPPPGVPAQLGFQYANLPFYIDGEVRSGDDYGITGVVHNTSQVKRVTAATVTLWGTPWAETHDPIRGSCLVPLGPKFKMSRCLSHVEKEPRAFLRLPTNCADPLATRMNFTNWTAPLEPAIEESSPGVVPTGCESVPFGPKLTVQPTTTVTDSPSGLIANLHIPQEDHVDPAGKGEADLRDVSVNLPRGIAINPAGGNGLVGCSSAQIDLSRNAPAQCPDASRIGTVEVETPLLDQTLPGSVFVATPHDNPFDSLLAIYVAVYDPVSGTVVKLPGRVSADTLTGQLRTTFKENPQLPFEDFTLKFFGGSFAALRSPAVCGTYTTTTSMTPWSAPASGPPVTGSNSYTMTTAPGGGGCPQSEGDLPFGPSFSAGSAAPIAGTYTPFTIHLRRNDGSQEIETLTVKPPPGLVANLRGTTYCSDSALVVAGGKSGRAELANPSCPASSDVGTAIVGAGAGPAPYFTQGKAYLAGPYRGAPLSLAIITPAVAGPYDLGTVVVRTALQIDPETAHITAVSDPIPHILQGIPLDVRDITVKLDRPNFTLNPTNCEPFLIVGEAGSTLGKTATLSDRFQVGECRRLRFAPKIAFRLRGGTRRSDHPSLRSTVTYPKGNYYANIARASVALPHSEFLEQSHIRTICTRVQFAARACPKGSIYGYARAFLPILDQPLQGPVYLRSSSNPLPDLVADLNGQIHVALVGRIDSVHGGIRTTFDTVPDAPVSKFVLTLKGGKKGLLVNSRNICAHVNRARVRFYGQNGKAISLRPVLKAKCRKVRHKHRRHHKRHRAGKHRHLRTSPGAQSVDTAELKNSFVP